MNNNDANETQKKIEVADQKEMLAILTEDIQSHRNYVQTLYRNALYVGGGVALGGFALAGWLIGNEFDATIFRYKLNDKIDDVVGVFVDARVKDAETIFEKADKLVENAEAKITDATDTQLESALGRLDTYIKEQVTVSVEALLKEQLEILEKKSETELASLISLPPGMIVAFDRASGCPAGWASFDPAKGRMVIGVDDEQFILQYVAGTPRYQLGGEQTHTLVLAEMPSHRHTITSSPPGKNIHDGFGGSGAHFGLYPVYDPSIEPQPGWSTTQHLNFMSAEGGNQPHNNMPPYIALHYCKKL